MVDYDARLWIQMEDVEAVCLGGYLLASQADVVDVRLAER